MFNASDSSSLFIQAREREPNREHHFITCWFCLLVVGLGRKVGAGCLVNVVLCGLLLTMEVMDAIRHTNTIIVEDS